MEDFKLILYILAVVAYFLYNTWRKAFKDSGAPNPPAENKPRPRPTAQQSPRPVTPRQPMAPPTSFEDILRELQPKVERAREEIRPIPKASVPEVKPEPTTSKYDTAPRVLSLENPVEARMAAQKVQERRQASFEAYTPKAAVPENRYAAMLRNPATVREAVIVSEILKRKFD